MSGDGKYLDHLRDLAFGEHVSESALDPVRIARESGESVENVRKAIAAGWRP